MRHFNVNERKTQNIILFLRFFLTVISCSVDVNKLSCTHIFSVYENHS